MFLIIKSKQRNCFSITRDFLKMAQLGQTVWDNDWRRLGMSACEKSILLFFFFPINSFTSHILDIMNYVDFILTELLYCRWYTHTATYQVNIQRTQISGRHYSNGTKHGIWPPEDGRTKGPKHILTYSMEQSPSWEANQLTETCRSF